MVESSVCVPIIVSLSVWVRVVIGSFRLVESSHHGAEYKAVPAKQEHAQSVTSCNYTT